MRGDHGAQRVVLSVHELWFDERVQLRQAEAINTMGAARELRSAPKFYLPLFKPVIEEEER